MKHIYPLIALFIMLSTNAFSQEEMTLDDVIRDLLEDMAIDGRLTEDGDEAQVLYQLAENKIDINSATADELRSIYILTESQVQSIIYERNRLGSFTSILDLLLLPEFDEWFIKRLARFVKYEDKAEKKRAHYLNGEMVLRVATMTPKPVGLSGDVKSPYLGLPIKLLSRNKLSLDDTWTIGAVAESDMGEPICSKGITLTDFTSGYLSYKKNGNGVTRAIVGHYHAHAGLGLGLWSGFAANQTSVQVSLDRKSEAITPTLSASESSYLRGAAFTIVHNKSYLTFFGSYTDNDASEREDTLAIFIQAIQTDGYHRSQNEIENRHNVNIKVVGGYAVQGFEAGKIGIGINRWSASKPLNNDDKLYRIHYPQTDEITTCHTYYKILFPRVKIYGELALQKSERYALSTLGAIDFALSGGSYISIGYRDFSRRYYCAVQNPYSKWSQPSGERGVYLGIQTMPIDDLSLLSTIDIYSNRWLTYHNNIPSSGYKIRLSAKYTLNETGEIAFKLRVDDNDVTKSEDNYIRQREQRLSYKVQYLTTPLRYIRFKGAAEYVYYRIDDGELSKGLWLSQELRLELEKICKLKATLFAAHFDTDDYNSRVYANLPDVLYSMSTPSFSGRGVLALGYMSIEPLRGMSLTFGVKRVRYLDRENIGTGNDMTIGAKRTELKVQLRYKLFHRL
ncbi:MAG: helix-hairpin-helix domain-containing protein [Bacteroidia bacterium]|nr:helix-hairpin-helix domain-containing protein [Bacteroidia bacterium]